jgi:hypothetical protein
MSKIILENPYIVTKITTYTKFEIKTVRINLNNNSASFVIIIYTEDEIEDYIDVKEFIMEGDDYTNWNLDNEYAISFIKTKLSET